jgi:tetratricopeptide (TPR) repeat protein
MLTNWFATSLARAGDSRSAARLWKQAAKLASGVTTAEENLKDLRQPPGRQWGPAYFRLRDWLSRAQRTDMQAMGDAAAQRTNDWDTSLAAVHQTTQRFLAKHPEVERIIPDMLDRGDTEGQRFALLIAPRSQCPEVKETLLNYLSGPRGTDEVRRQLLMTLQEQGHEFQSPLSMYSKGEPLRIELIGFEITDEPSVPEGRTDETCELLEAANRALHARNGVEAERLLRQARQIEPAAPDVLNNLAAALQLQNRMDEADLLIDEVIEKHPDYFFGQTAAAGRKVKRKEYDAAFQILVELQRRKQLHFTEFYALARMMVYACVGRGERAAAQHWLDMLERYEPEHPDIPALKRHIALHGSGIANLLNRLNSS